MTPEQVRAEHNHALAMLTREQVQAIDRVTRARQLTNFNGRPWRENLGAIFATEAEIRSEPDAGTA